MLQPRPRPGHRALRIGRASIPNQVYVVTFVTRDRIGWFREFAMARAASASRVAAVRATDAELLAWVLMPDHAHLLLKLGSRWPLPRIVQSAKAAMALAANRILGRRGSLWARAYHDHALRAEEDVAAAARYIVRNPVRAGLASRCGDYPYWDAVWLDQRSR
jgi:REP element-mobilizing transposase RayT